MGKPWYDHDTFRDIIAGIGSVATITTIYLVYRSQHPATTTTVPATSSPASITTSQTSSTYSPTASGSPLY